MKGARGLLISITGGNDLTLYEVDEAAGRIRQEVDEDANIILGATFDSSLDGIVRVSVVATGIDHPVGVHELNAAETRIAEVANRLRAQTAARPIETAPQPAFEARRPNPTRPPGRPMRSAQAQPAPQQQFRPAQAAQGVYVEEAAPQHPRYAEAAPSQARADGSFRTGSVHSGRRRFAARAAAENAADRRSAAAGAKSDSRPSRRSRRRSRMAKPSAALCSSGSPPSAPDGTKRARRRRSKSGRRRRGPRPSKGRRRPVPCTPNMPSVRRRARRRGRSSTPGSPISRARTRRTSSKSRRSCAASRAEREGAPSLALFRGEGHAPRIAGGLRGVAGAPQAGKDQLEAGRSATLMPL